MNLSAAERGRESVCAASSMRSIASLTLLRGLSLLRKHGPRGVVHTVGNLVWMYVLCTFGGELF